METEKVNSTILSSSEIIKNNITSIINISTNNKTDIFPSENFSKYLFIAIIFLLIMLLITSTVILLFILRKRKKINTNSISNNMVMNKIIIKNPPDLKPDNSINKKDDFQSVQNTSNVSNCILPQNILSEIKDQNLQMQIHNIINNPTSSSGGSSGRRKKKRSDNSGDNTKSLGIYNKDSNTVKSEEINTQKLEEEIKEQMKKYVVVEEKN